MTNIASPLAATPPPFDFAQTFLNSFKLRAIALTSCTLAVTVTVGAVVSKEPLTKTLLLGSALGLTAVSRLAENARTIQDRINQDVVDISDSARQQQLYSYMTTDAPTTGTNAVLELLPPVEGVDSSTPTVPLYDLADIAGQNHSAIVGESGSGKSFLTQYLVNTYFPPGSSILAMDTDASPTDWTGLKVVGKGGDIFSIEEQMNLDLIELKRRTQLKSEGEPVGVEQVRIVEEFPSLSADIQDTLDKGESNTSIDWLKKLLRRGRKYGMKVVLVSQEFEVKSLGITGEGALRKAFTVVYLGSQAFSQLDSIRDKELREELRAWLSLQSRPALVESGGRWFACPIPDIPRQTYTPEQLAYSPQELQDLHQAQDILKTEIEALGDVDELPDVDEGERYYIPAEKATTTAISVIELDNGEILLEDTAQYLHQLISGLRSEGVSKTKILKETMNMKGRKYSEGRQLWDKLEELYGEFDS